MFGMTQKTGFVWIHLFSKTMISEIFGSMVLLFILLCADTREMIAWMKGHESAIHSISLHASGRYALTTSVDTAHLWDMDTFQRKRKLNNKEDVGLLQVNISSLLISAVR